MNVRTFFTVAAITLSVGGCVAGGAGMPTAAVTSADEFVSMATVSNTFEIETSRLALQRSRDREVRRFARQMIRDHTAASARLQRVASNAGVPPVSPMLDAAHERMYDDLEDEPVGTFDSAYIEAQGLAHQEAITLFSGYAANGDNPRLQAFASDTLPTLQRHAEHVNMLASSRPVAGRM
ncbi:DUF4142 domain-containing protein [Chthonobacter rhizosphaerae]|uniref:DUF4142 domain-containing protein n=1 Tax=Chthonobacter rhizosphaerae TaxID=2735553 RepID=UPI0015EF2B47|nr:DUF4142 domain-containing protein [Chthonobacter rhizosphaerae]